MLFFLNLICPLIPPFFKGGLEPAPENLLIRGGVFRKGGATIFLLLLVLFQSDKIAADLRVAVISGDEAILAAERYTGKGKVLGTSFVAGEAGRTTYRVKILMPSGVLRTVVIDAETGGVVE